MKETIRLIATLTVICLVAGVLLALVDRLTSEPIAKARREAKLVAIRNVLPPFDNEPDKDVVVIDDNWKFFVGRKDGAFAGAAVESSTTKGYGGTIKVMIGVTADGKLRGIEILEHKETPGLGAKIASRAFRSRFAGRDIAKANWAVKKDGGDIDHITAATISSRAVVEAVKAGLEVYQKNRERIVDGGAAGTGSRSAPGNRSGIASDSGEGGE